MKKKVGEIIFTIQSSGDKRVIPIWGTMFKGDRGDFIGGIYYSVKPEEYDGLKPFIDETLKIYRFEERLIRKFWGDYISIRRYGLLKNVNFDKILDEIKGISLTSFDGIDVEIKINKEFQYVIDANIVENI